MAVLSPEVQAAFERAEAEADGDTVQLPTPAPAETKHAKNLLSLFERRRRKEAAPAAAAGKPAPPLAAALTAELGAARAAAKAPPPIVRFPEARAPQPARAGGPLAVLPGARGVGGAPRRSAAAVRGEANDTLACGAPPADERRRLEAALLHQNPGLEPADLAAVAAAALRRRGLFEDGPRAAPDVAAAGGDALFGAFAAQYAEASRGQVLHVRRHVLDRLDGTRLLAANPELDLVDAVTLTEGASYAHAYKRPDFKPLVTKDGAFVLGVRDHLTRGADEFLHQDAAIDLKDLAAVKERARLSKISNKLKPKFRRRL
ncbi:hypothetical protein JL722_1747 [Aureococcus anophagefferens]|nr:hypothetical protein JL722_1747 [Aureococcus anophagefferens]